MTTTEKPAATKPAAAKKPAIVCGAILEAIWAAQETFAPIFKSEKNEHLNSKYASLASTLAAMAPALRANGILYLRSYDAAENALVTTFRHM